MLPDALCEEGDEACGHTETVQTPTNSVIHVANLIEVFEWGKFMTTVGSYSNKGPEIRI